MSASERKRFGIPALAIYATDAHLLRQRFAFEECFPYKYCKN